MCNCSQALSQLSFLGETGVGIASVSSAVVGLNTEITFHMTDGSTLGPVAIVNGTQGAAGNNGSNAATKAWILDSFIGAAYEVAPTTFNANLTTKSTIPANTLTQAGDTVKFEIVMTTASMGINPLSWGFGFKIQGVSVATLGVTPILLTVKGSITRVTNTLLYYDISLVNTAANPGGTNLTFQTAAFKSVTSLTATACDLEIGVVNNLGQDVNLIKFNTEVIIK